MWWVCTLRSPIWALYGGGCGGLKLDQESVFSIQKKTFSKNRGQHLCVSLVWLIWSQYILADWVSVFNTLPLETWAVDILIGILLVLGHLRNVKAARAFSVLCSIGWQPGPPQPGLSVPATGSQAGILLEGHGFSMFPQLSCQILRAQITEIFCWCIYGQWKCSDSATLLKPSKGRLLTRNLWNSTVYQMMIIRLAETNWLTHKKSNSIKYLLMMAHAKANICWCDSRLWSLSLNGQVK